MTTHIMGHTQSDDEVGYPGICGHKYDPNCRETRWAVDLVSWAEEDWCERCLELEPLFELGNTEL